MSIVLLTAILVVAIALFFDFTNGFHDAANQVAAVIVSRALKPSLALFIAATAEFFGAYFLGTAVAKTIGGGIVDPRIFQEGSSSILVIISALIGAILWNLITWYFGIPSSSSHALIGGLIGAFLFGWGIAPVDWTKVLKIILVMIVSPIIGFVIAYIFTRFTLVFTQWSSPKINKVFKKLQIASSIAQALSHGTNDGQKTMGVIVFALIILGIYNPVSREAISVPTWVIFASSSAIALGTMSGGWKIIKKLGAGLYKIRPIHGFASQTTSALIIYLTAIFGFPISTTHVISSSVMGTGAAFRPKMIRWQVAREMMMVWFITIPISGLTAGLTFLALNAVFGV